MCSWCNDMRPWDTKTSSIASISKKRYLSNYKATGMCRTPSNIRMNISSPSKRSSKTNFWETTISASSHTRLSSIFVTKWKSKRRRMIQLEQTKKNSRSVNMLIGQINKNHIQIVFFHLKKVQYLLVISHLSFLQRIIAKLLRRKLRNRPLKWVWR